jgi:hypothetical protein
MIILLILIKKSKDKYDNPKKNHKCWIK